MGVINISIQGSFERLEKGPHQFSAQLGGHALAVSKAIEFLSKEVLPSAIQQDHYLHDLRQFPAHGFGTITKRQA